MQGELKAGSAGVPRPGALRMLFRVVRQEGVASLYAGLSAAVVRHVFYTGRCLGGHQGLHAW